nr:hypothetical protein [Lachnospiraceae bacterium]
EALYRGAPVIAGTHPVLREAGGDLCDYVDPDDPKAFAELLIRLGTVQDPAPAAAQPGAAPGERGDDALHSAARTGLEQRRERIAKWRAANTFDTWEDAGRRLLDALDGSKTLHRPDSKDFATIEPAVIPPERLHQLLILTARAEDLLRSLPVTERHLPFLDELILGCPEKMVSEVQANYHGRLKVTFLTDEALLAGRPLPADHAARNMLLRYLAISDPHLEDAFLMGDDDSRPLQDMTAADFYAEGGVCYKGLILQDLVLWHGTEGKRVSFDVSMFKARDFLIAHGMPTFMHDAHCMQVIDKRYFLEMVQRFPETVEQAAVSEWNGPFNYMAWAYPEVIRFEPYATVNWPGFDEDWDPLWRADVPLFENHYDSAYEPESFYDHPGRLYGIDEEDEAAKVDRDIFLRKSRAAVQNAYRSWEKAFAEANGCRPVFVLTEEGIKVPARMELHLPSWVEAPFLRLSIRHFGVRRTSETESVATSGKSKTSAAAASSGKASAKATYETASEYDTQLTFVISENALPVVSPGSSRFSASSLRPVHVLLQLPAKAGTFTVTWTCYTNDRKGEAVTELILTYD